MSIQHHEITPDIAREAISYIPADEREVWLDVGFGLHHTFNGSHEGYSIWVDWAKTGKSFDIRACRDTWRSAKGNHSGNPKTWGTIVFYAKEYGWRPRYGEPLSPEAAAAKKQAREKAELEQARLLKERQAKTIEQATALWKAATPAAPDHPYLLRKNLQPLPSLREIPLTILEKLVGFSPKNGDIPLEGRILLAPIKVGSALSSMEMIDERGRKSALPGAGTRSGGYWMTSAPSVAEDGSVTILVGEGVATVMAASTATGFAGIATFSNTNILGVMRWVAEKWKAARVGVLLDRNKNGEFDRLGKSAAAKYQQIVIAPPLQDGESDFCDLWVRAGADAVREAICSALVAPTLPVAVVAPECAESMEDAPAPRKELRLPHYAPKGGEFQEASDGVYYIPDERSDATRAKICSPISVVARVADADGGAAGYLLEWKNSRGETRQWAAPAEMLHDRSLALHRALAAEGADISTEGILRDYLLEYIRTYPTKRLVTTATQIGWSMRPLAYVMPHRSICAERISIVYQSAQAEENRFPSAGSVEEWRDHVARVAAGNSRLAFAIMCAFAGPLLRVVDELGCGFHLFGASSSGKSTAQRLAASVWGYPDKYMRSWRTTTNGLEGIAAAHNDNVLILDEIGQVSPKEVGASAYMLANGMGKTRSTRSGVPRPAATFRLVFLSSGEVPQALIAAQGGGTTYAGQELRMLDIPVDAGRGMGVMETLHGAASASDAIAALTTAMRTYYGTAGERFLAHIAHHWDDVARDMKAAVKFYCERFAPAGSSSGQTIRAARSIAIAAAAGELATNLGITGWDTTVVDTTAAAIFQAWSARFGHEQREIARIYAQVRGFFEMHGSSRFENADRYDDAHERVQNRAGFSRRNPGDDAVTFYVLPEAFRTEICRGLDHKEVAKVLIERGWILGSGNKQSQVQRLPGIGPTRCYVFTSAMWADTSAPI